jgi:hypothetical protein
VVKIKTAGKMPALPILLTPNTPALSVVRDRDLGPDPDRDLAAANSDHRFQAFPASTVSSPVLPAAAQDRPAAPAQAAVQQAHRAKLQP